MYARTHTSSLTWLASTEVKGQSVCQLILAFNQPFSQLMLGCLSAGQESQSSDGGDAHVNVQAPPTPAWTNISQPQNQLWQRILSVSLTLIHTHEMPNDEPESICSPPLEPLYVSITPPEMVAPKSLAGRSSQSSALPVSYSPFPNPAPTFPLLFSLQIPPARNSHPHLA